MFQPVDFPRRLPALAFLALIAFGAFGALDALGAPFDADPDQVAALIEELDDGFEVLALSESYVLQPIDPEADYRSIEIKPGSLVVDGETVSGDQLRERVGAAAEAIVALSELGSAEPSTSEEIRDRIERLGEERRIKAEEIDELVRSRVEELESLEGEHLEALEDAIDEQRRDERRRRRRGSVRTDTRVSFGSSLRVEENETSRDVVVLGGSLDVEGKVRGDAVVVGGSVEIRGEVSGTVTAVGGSISLGPGARIDGDAISIGGAVHRDPTADVFGEITEVSLAPGLELDDLWDDVWLPHWHFGWFDFGVGELIVRVGKTVVLAVLLLLLVLLFPRLAAAVSDRVQRQPWKAGMVGLGAQLLFLFALPVICIILLITIVGIPLALILGPLASLVLVVLFLLGFTGVAMAGGQLLQARFGWRGVSPYLLVVLGLALIQGWSILGEVLGFLGGPIRFFAWILLLLGFLIKYIAWTTGLGAVLLHYLSPSPAVPRYAKPRPAPPSPASPFPASRSAPHPAAPRLPPPPASSGRPGGRPGVAPPSVPSPDAAEGDNKATVDVESEPEEEEAVDPDEQYLRVGEGGSGAAEDAEPEDAEPEDAETAATPAGESAPESGESAAPRADSEKP